MAHSHKARYARYRHHNIWWCKHVQFNARAYPAKPAERARGDLDAQLHDLHLESLGVELDREISPKGRQQSLATDWDDGGYDDYDYWGRRDIYDLRDSDWDWRSWDDSYEESYYDYQDPYEEDERDPSTAAWLALWVAGVAETPVDWWSREYDLRDYDPVTFEDDLDDEIRAHFEWLHESDDTILVVEAIDLRNAERKRAGERHYQNHRRAA